MPTTEPVEGDDARVLALTRALLDEMGERYRDDPGEIEPPHPDAAWLLLRDDAGHVVGCGAVQPLRTTLPDAPAEHGEIKRVYVDPAHRGRGHSRVLMDALVELARGLGYTWLQLETGTVQHEAVGLYRSSGWQPLPAYGQYAHDPRTVCFGLPLAPAAQAQGQTGVLGP